MEQAMINRRIVPQPSVDPRFVTAIQYGTWCFPATKAYMSRPGPTSVVCDRCRAPHLPAALHYDNIDLCAACMNIVLASATPVTVSQPFVYENSDVSSMSLQSFGKYPPINNSTTIQQQPF